MRWQTPQRYYRVESYRDLLGQLVVAVANGGRHNNLGQLRIIPVEDEKERDQLLKRLSKERRQHHYDFVH